MLRKTVKDILIYYSRLYPVSVKNGTNWLPTLTFYSNHFSKNAKTKEKNLLLHIPFNEASLKETAIN